MDLIDRDKLKEYPIRLNDYDKKNGNIHFIYGIESVMEYADCLPSVQIRGEPLVVGKWREICTGDIYICENCRRISKVGFNWHFCPVCGAKNEKEKMNA